mgnify:CR=1 FL=1
MVLNLVKLLKKLPKHLKNKLSIIIITYNNNNNNNLILDLEIINQINDTNKLSVNLTPGHKQLSVDSYYYLSSIIRWYYSLNRHDIIDYLEELVEKINKSAITIIDGNHCDIGLTLKKSIRNSLSGLEKLKQTYHADSIIVARLILIINKFNNSINILENLPIDNNMSLSMITNIETNFI